MIRSILLLRRWISKRTFSGAGNFPRVENKAEAASMACLPVLGMDISALLLCPHHGTDHRDGAQRVNFIVRLEVAVLFGSQGIMYLSVGGVLDGVRHRRGHGAQP